VTPNLIVLNCSILLFDLLQSVDWEVSTVPTNSSKCFIANKTIKTIEKIEPNKSKVVPEGIFSLSQVRAVNARYSGGIAQ
jgi:hypothetical protein